MNKAQQKARETRINNILKNKDCKDYLTTYEKQAIKKKSAVDNRKRID